MFFEDKRFVYLLLAVFIITGLMGMTRERTTCYTINFTSRISCNNIS